MSHSLLLFVLIQQGWCIKTGRWNYSLESANCFTMCCLMLGVMVSYIMAVTYLLQSLLVKGFSNSENKFGKLQARA